VEAPAPHKTMGIKALLREELYPILLLKIVLFSWEFCKFLKHVTSEILFVGFHDKFSELTLSVTLKTKVYNAYSVMWYTELPMEFLSLHKSTCVLFSTYLLLVKSDYARKIPSSVTQCRMSLKPVSVSDTGKYEFIALRKWSLYLSHIAKNKKK
jgi:hypothetical protein